MGNSERAGELLPKDPTGSPPIEYELLPPLRHSGPGIASFVVALLALGVLVAVFTVINGRSASDMLPYVLLGLALILPLIGTVLGAMSLFQRRRYRGLPIAGLTINTLLCILLLLAIVPSLIHELMM